MYQHKTQRGEIYVAPMELDVSDVQLFAINITLLWSLKTIKSIGIIAFFL
jgi:hypothetical protein